MTIVNKFNVNREQVTLDVIYDVTTNNSSVTFESLQSLLSSPNLDTLIPTSVRYGGMTIRFVQSSDNMYVQYRLMANAWSTDIEDWSFCGNDVYVNNPDLISVVIDNENKILEVLKADGSKEINGNTTINGNTNVNGSLNQQGVVTMVTDNPEYLNVTIDDKSKLLSARTIDGIHQEFVGIETPEVRLKSSIIGSIDDFDNRQDIKLDNNGGIISYINDKGYRVESVGIITEKAEIKEVNVDSVVSKVFKQSSDNIKEYDLPDNGVVNITSETFYLTSHSGYSDKSGIYPIQVYENNRKNAELLRICQVYYVKNTLTDNGDGTYSINKNSVALTFYAASDVKKINETYYVSDTLADGQPTEDSISVTQIIDTPNIEAWPVNKKVEHQCVVTIDFGKYLSGTFYIGVKFQGNSTLYRPKRNLRFTFYKNNKYEKKLKVKIGEMVRLSGYNLKAFIDDSTRVKEYILNRVFMAMWEKKHNANDEYPWNKENGYYTNATGMIKSFPIKIEIENNFYGMYMFGLKKDERNYLLNGDDDSSGIFISSDTQIDWDQHTAHDWSDEMGVTERNLAYIDRGDDSVSVESAQAINNFFDFVKGTLYVGSNGLDYQKNKVTEIDSKYYVTDTLTNNGDGTYSVNDNSISCNILMFNKENVKERMFIDGFLDYIIGVEAFHMGDNAIHNMILYSSRDKKKFAVFFYDLDLSLYNLNRTYKGVIHTFLFDKLLDLFSDEIHSRWIELRKSVLNVEYIDKLYNYSTNVIPYEWIKDEEIKWGNIDSFKNILPSLKLRLEYLDNEFFNIKN